MLLNFARHSIKMPLLITALCLTVPGLSVAQTTPTTPGTTAARDYDDDGMDWGWIGLLGLAGLAGLYRRRPEYHTDTTARRP